MLGLVLGSGASGLVAGPGVVTLDRHGDSYTLPHRIDHGANMRRLAGAGCDRVLAVASVGGLRPELGPGTLVCPDDFIALDAAPVTTHDGLEAHRVPGFDAEWRARVFAAVSALAEVRDGGVYWQATGPRLETPAEIRLIAEHADVIGMTVASECVVAGELGLPYAAICVVDNLANGVAGTRLTLAELERQRVANRERLEAALSGALATLA